MKVEERLEEFIVERITDIGTTIRETVIGTVCYEVPECLNYRWIEKVIIPQNEKVIKTYILNKCLSHHI